MNSTLTSLAQARFGGLSEAETKLLHAAPSGKWAISGPSEPADPLNDPRRGAEWGMDREIRARVIRWLCVDPVARASTDANKIRILGARITGKLDLSFLSYPFPISLRRCRLVESATLRASEVPELDFSGSWTQSLNLSRARVKSCIYLDDGFLAHGLVTVLGAHIQGDLVCKAAEFNNPFQPGVPESGRALSAEALMIQGSIYLSDGFKANGEISLIDAHIGGSLYCTNGLFSSPSAPGREGRPNKALYVDRAIVEGSIFLNDKFRAQGDVHMLAADIGGNLACDKGSFEGKFVCEGTVIGGALFWRDVDASQCTSLNLINVSASALADDKNSYPESADVRLDGFAYKRIASGWIDARSRLRWLLRQKAFSPEPYRQLSRVLRDTGDDIGARRTLFELERRRRAEKDSMWYHRLRSWVMNLVVGYGYYPSRALWGLIALTLLGLCVFWTGERVGSIAPTEKEAYISLKQDHKLPRQYDAFYPLIYSLENSFPLIKFGQAERWQPDPDPQWRCTRRAVLPYVVCQVLSPTSLRIFRCMQIGVGWFLTSMGIAAISGLVRKD